ncbi:MAG: tetratricopeptide repeat protein [Kofleriaceae bacterium]
MKRRVVATAVVMMIAAGTASAQSKRYPPEPIDHDREGDEHSTLWENATNPRRTSYDQLMAEARDTGDRTTDQLLAAVAKLDQAIALMPEEPAAYRMRGEAHLQLRAWAKCASDLESAADRTTSDAAANRRLASDQRRKLGLCLARAGKLADAERMLADAAATETSYGLRSELLMRLGETRIAMGKLDEAIASLTAALEITEPPSQPMIRWQLAAAYDRARRPAEAMIETRRAAEYDRNYTTLLNPPLPMIGDGEAEYLLGLAYATAEPARAEYALVYFRQFLKLAPASPWRKRADDHLRELKGSELPESIDRRGGAASLDLDTARSMIRRQMSVMRGCVAKLHGVAIEITITRSGPRSTRTTPTGRRVAGAFMFTLPPEGVAVVPQLNLDNVSRADLDAAIRCIEPAANRIALPAIKERDQFYKIAFTVVSP